MSRVNGWNRSEIIRLDWVRSEQTGQIVAIDLDQTD